MLQDTQPSHRFSNGGGNLGLRSSISRMTNHPGLLGIKAALPNRTLTPRQSQENQDELVPQVGQMVTSVLGSVSADGGETGTSSSQCECGALPSAGAP